MSDAKSEPLSTYRRYREDEMRRRARSFYEEMNRRRTVRAFSAELPPAGVIEDCLRAAGTAPSGANRQPWRFVVVTDPLFKRRIREAAEREERAFYERRAPREWLDALAPLGTDARKAFLEVAPYLIAVFAERFGVDATGARRDNYYVTESVGFATGLLIAALHHAGLACLTHTPSPMRFLNDILLRPESERPFVLLVVGYPAEGATVPTIARKSLAEIASFFDQP